MSDEIINTSTNAPAKPEEIERIEKFIGKASKYAIKQLRDLQGLALFEDQLNNLGEVAREKSQRTNRSSAMEQILLEERDCYEKTQKAYETSLQIFDRLMDQDDDLDAKTIMQIMGKMNSAEQAASKHLVNMRKGVETASKEVNASAMNMGKLLEAMAKQRFDGVKWQDRMQLEWARVEKITGYSREQLLKMMDDDDF